MEDVRKGRSLGREWDGLDTEAITVVAQDTGETFVLVPVVDTPGQHLTVYSDGSFTRWCPKDVRCSE